MRQLVIVCGRDNAPAVKAGLAQYGHPRAVFEFVTIVEVDLGAEINPRQLRADVYEVLTGHAASSKAIGEPLVCATRETTQALGLTTLKGMIALEGKVVHASALCTLQASNGQPLIARLLNQCDLSLRNASAHFISQWDHHQLGRPDVLAWLDQFGQLGRLTWIGEAILRSLRLIDANALGLHFATIFDKEDGALCVNRDARRHGKSGDTIATLITKRSSRVVYESPATAIDIHNHRRIILFEDGLWSGTEAMGVIESLQGKRPDKEKTRALRDVACLSDIDFTFAYGLATNYGKAVVNKFILNEGLSGQFRVVAADEVDVASEKLISDIENGRMPLNEIREIGPPVSELRPYVVEQFNRDTTLTDVRRQEAVAFCRDVGRQLFGAYLDGMRKSAGWDSWPKEKVDMCGLGMNGLGMVHAFSHSVPKATMPLIWGSGEVEWKGRRVLWRPLLPNA